MCIHLYIRRMRVHGLALVGYMIAQAGYVEEGQASYYAPSFHGRRTASGEKYDRWAMTAAHRTLPFNTHVRVTNRRTGKSVVVRINDRGPVSPRRIIDLSEAAAKELGILQQGVAQVKIEVVSPPATSPAPSTTQPSSAAPRPDMYYPDGRAIEFQPFGVQIAAFSDEFEARRYARDTQSKTGERTFIWRAVAGARTVYRVVLGPFRTSEEATGTAQRLRKSGWNTLVVNLRK